LLRSSAFFLNWFRQAEVHQLHNALPGQEQVVRLDVAVHHALPVRGLQSLRRLDRNLEKLFLVQWPASHPFT